MDDGRDRHGAIERLGLLLGLFDRPRARRFEEGEVTCALTELALLRIFGEAAEPDDTETTASEPFAGRRDNCIEGMEISA